MTLVAAVIVLYNPQDDVLRNIQACLKQVESLYLVDNSEKPTSFLSSVLQNKKVVYHWNGGNRGIAHALNLGANNALAAGFQWLLTLDQDSCVEPGMVDALVAQIGAGNLGILAPGELVGVDLETRAVEQMTRVLTVWTSGNLLNLNAYKDVGPFCEELFVDFVDHEYCLRLNQGGYVVSRVPGARLRHCFGENAWRIVLFNRSFWISNHSPLRRYYITRNRLFIRKIYKKKFPLFVWKDRFFFMLEFVAIVLFEKRKIEKFAMSFKGYRDFCRGKKGRFPDTFSGS